MMLSRCMPRCSKYFNFKISRNYSKSSLFSVLVPDYSVRTKVYMCVCWGWRCWAGRTDEVRENPTFHDPDHKDLSLRTPTPTL